MPLSGEPLWDLHAEEQVEVQAGLGERLTLALLPGPALACAAWGGAAQGRRALSFAKGTVCS